MSLDTSADIDLMFDVFNEPAPARKKTVDFDAVREKTKKVIERHRNVLLKRRAGNEDVDDMVETEGAKKLKLEHQINNAGEAHVSEYIRNIKTHKLDTLESCMHEVVLPPNAELKPLTINTVKPAKVYAFPLDPFQKESVLCLENQQSVLVSAHTSAGKTVVAEYAIAMALRDKQRVIYTTPIKALSNQKYREFLDEFKDVGLMTGDITINPSASCLVMTTEILRSMLYKGSELMREVGWVVFDEIHYMRDKERGVVWEETIILLPDNVHYVFLSATIPNARQFAEWIVFLHKQPCHVVYTEYRPTPLEHYLFPAGGDGLYQVVNTSSEFNEVNFMAAMEKLANGDGAKGDQRGSKGGIKNGGGSNCYKIVKLIMERNFAPVIVFSFSKRDCEKYSQEMSSLDFNTEEEAKLVEEVFSNAIDTLKEEDQMLPQVKMIYPLLQKGIGVHHSGLLPLLKEVIEILFGEGLIKALFATETFAMGLNMPARTVLFTSARKFDGKDFRWVTSGEYIQMSGRAGRRGLDDKGLVILMVDEKMTPATGKQIIKGQADPLNSSFHLTYSMVLNLLRVEEINPEYMLERSFFQFQNYGAIPELLDELKTLEAKYNEISIHNEAEVASYHKLKSKLKILNRERLTYIQNPKKLMPFMTSGRVVRVCVGEVDFGYCPVVKFYENKHNKNQVVLNEEKDYNILVIAYVTKETAHEKSITRMEPYPLENAFGGEAVAVTVKPTMLTEVSKINMKNMNNMHCRDFRMVKIAELQRVKRIHGFAQLDAEKDMKIKKPFFKAVVTKIEEYEGLIASHALHNNKDFTAISEKYEEKAQIGLEVKEVKQRLKQKQSLLQMQELRHRKRILRRMGYAKASDVIELKGRIACEIDSADELVITELLFNGMFNNLSPQQCCAILSCFVFQERANEMPKLKEELSAPLRVIQDTARRIAKVSQECKLTLDEDEYVESFKPHLMNLVYAWSNGSSFINIIQMTDVMEGSIIRCMRRLEELLGQMRLAAKNLGNIELENKFSDATMSIKRDIVFAASLYL